MKILRLPYGKLPDRIGVKGSSKIFALSNMASPNHPKATARLEARISPEIKALLQKAADLEGRTLTDFIVASVQAEAYRVIEQHQTLKLSVEDSEAFVDALLNPPTPNDSLKAAAVRYQQVMSV